VLFGLILLFGIVTAAIVYFERGIGGGFQPDAVRMPGLFGVLLLCVTAAAVGFTFLGVTQETADCYPMRKRRAVFYALAAGVITFGLVLFPLTYFAAGLGLMEAIATLLPFAIPGAGLLAFLCLTEAGRLKPWAAERAMAEMRGAQEMLSGAGAVRFGLYSGAIWIFALGAFVTLGFLIGFRYSWLAFIFAVAVQLVVQALCMGQKGGSPGQHTELET
jgi:hypothetical protein